MKGIINIEFVIALLVFISTVSFVSMMVINSLPALRYEAISNDMKSRAYQLSNVLLANFSNQDYVLDMNNINEMKNKYCSSPDDYENFRNLFSEYLTLEIEQLDGTELISCKPAIETRLKPEFTLKRFATVNNEIIVMNIGIIR
jgi:hypothetical protein